MKIDRIDAITSRIKLQRKNPRFKRCAIKIEYPTLATLLLKESSLLAKMLAHSYYTDNVHIFPLNMLVEGLKK